MTKHKQVRVCVGNRKAAVDKELAPLIKELWRAEISTVLSCQENRPGIAWILFEMPGDLCRFFDIVGEYDSESGSLYRRITGRDDEGCWEYALLPEDDGLYEGEERGEMVEWHEGQVSFYLSPSVRFPRTDLPILLDRMRRHNERLLQHEEKCFQTKTAEFHLPIYKQGDDLAEHLREEKDTEAGLLAYAERLKAATSMVETLAQHTGWLKIEQADTHCILVSGPELLIDALIEEGLLTAECDTEGQDHGRVRRLRG